MESPEAASQPVAEASVHSEAELSVAEEKSITDAENLNVDVVDASVSSVVNHQSAASAVSSVSKIQREYSVASATTVNNSTHCKSISVASVSHKSSRASSERSARTNISSKSNHTCSTKKQDSPSQASEADRSHHQELIAPSSRSSYTRGSPSRKSSVSNGTFKGRVIEDFITTLKVENETKNCRISELEAKVRELEGKVGDQRDVIYELELKLAKNEIEHSVEKPSSNVSIRARGECDTCAGSAATIAELASLLAASEAKVISVTSEVVETQEALLAGTDQFRISQQKLQKAESALQKIYSACSKSGNNSLDFLPVRSPRQAYRNGTSPPAGSLASRTQSPDRFRNVSPPRVAQSPTYYSANDDLSPRAHYRAPPLTPHRVR